MKPLVLFASPQPTSSVAASVTSAPSIAVFTEPRRVRTLETAMTNDASGAMTIRGTAQPSVDAGSK